MRELPLIVSVDDHVIEPATVWTDRLPKKYLDVGPRIVRAPVKEMTFVGGKFTAIPGEPGDPASPAPESRLRSPEEALPKNKGGNPSAPPHAGTPMPALFLAASNIKRRTMAPDTVSPLRYSHLR